MTVGELSRRTGVSVKALREYTDLGLIRTLGRSPANYRLYDSVAEWCVRLIGELRSLGLTVAEIRELTSRCATSFGTRLPDYLDRSRERLEQRIAAARQTLRRIEDFQAEHRAGPLGYDDVCPTGDPRCAASA
ncbi:MerR family DNA-binding transcriptional regulator [Amycolatopsis echigonensis]|uniref:MerR family DNA-binding transcriptional regulator n=2 Tax=Amycolatopsis echigonensis TaxID=2576905 RepID=A0A8E1W5H0_9PSEU|nr:MerR family DNA-binding transcriptional regulator [Amycolatopsis echigonensis]